MTLKDHLRIIGAIAAKDLTDAIKNKIIQGLLVGIGFLMLSSQAMGFMVRLKTEPTAYYVDMGKSTVVKGITLSRELAFYPENNLASLRTTISMMAEPVLGVIIPSDFDEQLQAGRMITLQTEYAHWPKSSKIEAVVSYFEHGLSQSTGVNIRLELRDQPVYPSVNNSGYPLMIASGLVLGVMTVGLFLTPYLFLEERDTHTLDALLISPARPFHLVTGKALVGLSYSLAASVVIFLFSWRWVVHWEIALFAVFLGGLCAVAVGLLAGVLYETVTAVNGSVAIMVTILMLPMFMPESVAARLPSFLPVLIEKLPSLAMYKMVRLSFTNPLAESILPYIGILLLWILVIMGLVIARIRRMDR